MAAKPTGTIHERLAWLMSNLPVVKKQQVNAGGGGTFKAFAIDDIYKAFHPKFAEAGVVIMPRVQSVTYAERTSRSGTVGVEARVVVEYRFYAPDGTNVSMRCAAQGLDYQDKAVNKAVQQAIKYGLVQAFLQPTGEPDPDAQAPLDTTESKPPRDKPDTKKVTPTDRAWAKVVDAFPDDPQTMWWAIRDKLDIGDGVLNEKQAKQVIAETKKMADG